MVSYIVNTFILLFGLLWILNLVVNDLKLRFPRPNTDVQFDPVPHEGSDFENLLEFDARLKYIEEEYKKYELVPTDSSVVKSGDAIVSNAINYGNLALLYKERDTQWKQGGTYEALHYVNKALDFSLDVNDVVNSSKKLKNSLLLYQGILLMDLGHKHKALNVFDSLLSDYYNNRIYYDKLVNDEDISVDQYPLEQTIDLLELRDLSAVMYYKADTLLMLFNDNLTEAIDLFKLAIDIYPCNHNAYSKLIFSIKQQNLLQPQEYLPWITYLEIAMSNVYERSRHSIVFLDGDEIVCHFEATDIGTTISSLNNIIDVGLIQGSFYSALFTAADAAKNYPLAWDYLTKQRQMDLYLTTNVAKFDMNTSVTKAEHITSFFQPGYWPPEEISARPEGMGITSRVPVFIVGFFRSGSTLLETMLSAHSNIWGMGENSPFGYEWHFMQEEINKMIKNMGTEGDSDKEGEVQDVSPTAEKPDFNAVMRKHANRVVVKMRNHYKQHMAHMNDSVELSCSSEDSSEDKQVCANKVQKNVKRIVDKMLSNYYHIALIHLLFPKAIILHTIRDPLDTLFSCMKTRFGDPASTYTLRDETLVKHYVLYLEIMAHFRKVLPMITSPANSSLKIKPLVDIRYERLVANPEQTMRYVLDLLGLPWEDGVLKYTEAGRTVHTASALQVKQSIYHTSVGQWRKYTVPLNTSLIPLLRKEIVELQARGIKLPFFTGNLSLISDDIEEEDIVYTNRSVVHTNWYLNPAFNYTHMLSLLSK